MPATRLPTARDVMAKTLISLRPEHSLAEAIVFLRSKQISGAPVIDGAGQLVGMLSEYDCLRVLASGEFFDEDHAEEQTVGANMTREMTTVDIDADLYSIAHLFLSRKLRRVPVLEQGRVVGCVSRRDVLRGVESVWEQRRTQSEKPKVAGGLFLSATEADRGVIAARRAE
ncbi:MAG: CBS domain-containing protein [Planctomycetes bacterium]|nr:CBS domain-containing protein [Planctomycetota bacterium]